ncbi:MAG: alcohol dehydrogenase catalytic domain-containing protein [Christensenella sp.]|nr:alcohol dehydrogenase catalytic domain-containing protein [Christensenella sp.]
MKAAVLEELNKMVVKDVPKPVITDDEILVKVKSCAICGSDIRIFRHGNDRVNTPCIIGHEVAGEVAEVGKNVSHWKIGDRVAIGADIPCGECKFCKAGFSNNCMINYATGYQFQGGFAEYIPLNKIMLTYGPIVKIPDHVSYDQAALAEPLGCVLNGMILSSIKLGDTVVVIGTGPIGCMIMEVVRLMGATKIIVVEMDQDRLNAAKQFAGDVFIHAGSEDVYKRIMEETDGMGAEVVITACPSPNAQADALRYAKNRGRVNLFGGLAHGTTVTMDTNIIHYKELFVHGTHGSLPIHHMKAVELIASGILDTEKFISHRLPLDDILKGIAIAENKEGKRVVINP